MKPGDYIELFIPLMIAIVITVWVVTRYVGTSKQTRAQLASGAEHRALTDEYRRLSDLAITAQEHTDLRLTEISVRLDELRDRLERMQRILNEVE